MGRYNRYGTNKYFFCARGTAFLSRIPVTRIQRATALEYIKKGKMKPWYYRKEQVLGAPIALNFDYQPRPVRLVGTVMDTFGHQSTLRGAIRVVARNEATNVAMWVPVANPKLRYEMTGEGSYEHFLDERDKWDEAWMTGRARVK